MSDVTPEVRITGKTVEVVGNGFGHSVTVQENETVGDALKRIGVSDAVVGSVDLLIKGERLDAGSVSAEQITDGETLVAPPKNPALGS